MTFRQSRLNCFGKLKQKFIYNFLLTLSYPKEFMMRNHEKVFYRSKKRRLKFSATYYIARY